MLHTLDFNASAWCASDCLVSADYLLTSFSGWHFDAIGVSKFRNLQKFTLRAEDDDGSADMAEVRAVLDSNTQTLQHLCLGASLNRPHSWDEAFESSVLRNLVELNLVDTRISHLVLTRLVHASSLRS